MKKLLLFFFLLLIPVMVFAEDIHESELIPGAKSGVLMEVSTGEFVFSKEMYMEVPVASMTKMVAQILILEAIRDKKINWDDVVTVSKSAADMGGSQIYLSVGEKISIRDLMKGISMASANDATVMMAEVIAGSEKDFVKMMNKKVQELGLEHTHFVNSTGLDEEGHYSCSYDMAVIARELITNYPEILEFSSVYEDYLREDTENKFWLVNTNKLLKLYDGVDGLKTGYTKEAGYCLVTTAKRDDQRIIGVLMNESAPKTRNEEMCNLLDYGFNNYQQITLFKKDSVIEQHLVDKMDNLSIDVKCKQDIVYTKAKNSNEKATTKITYQKDLLPVKQGDPVGNLEVIVNGKTIANYELYSGNDVSKATFLSKAIKTFKYLF